MAKKNGAKTLAELKTLGNKLLSSRAHINNLPVLLTFVNPSSAPQYALEALLSLQAFFTPLIPDLPSTTSAADPRDEPEIIYSIWLRSKFEDLVQSLIDIATSSQCEQALREVVLDALMEFVKVGNSGKFHPAIYRRFLHSIVHSSLGVDDILLHLLATKYFNYIDIRYFTYINMEKLSQTLEAKYITDYDNKISSGDSENPPRESMELSVQKIYYILSHIPPPDGLDQMSKYEMWNGLGIFVGKNNNRENALDSKAESKIGKAESSSDKVLPSLKVAKKMKLKFTKAWISFLKIPLPLDVYKEVLVSLHQAVIPYLSKPIMLCDFLTRSYDIGGVVSVMALSSLFILMTQHGIEYPNFYEKLYALLEPSIFMAKHRAKFFELLDSCLKSPLLPAYLAAAFCKKLSRLSLSVPPSGSLVITALIHNLLRRHPSINCLVHQDDTDETTKENSEAERETDVTADACTEVSVNGLGIDPFDEEERDPLRTNAMRSSLWEIDTLRHHYCPPVSRFVLSLENDLTVRAKTTEIAVKDFSSGSYATIFGDEIRRRVKQVPLAFYKVAPTSLFSESDFPGWTFDIKNKELAGVNQENDVISAKRQRVECS
ncbi:nucleolar complex protein 4 homolog [Ipomoea triloba]|uniref:nucleolar complex protein 4 homolog n=1 Tax=Ipomoea triloba TaxID=35885 RepID=UPI00125D5188|nr:nucleolar complex protein 4 homolog [Ipomoea triloba]XP_031112384.1 nucleolar complex protein 4 homolog [Ipomoea triloba]XP_031112385.1 nucleolar complex protein 4 homolog [Ipomoea triloba]XP_031112386.1 nucleolar complex protein 4 homolog [Ipomoea triloba]